MFSLLISAHCFYLFAHLAFAIGGSIFEKAHFACSYVHSVLFIFLVFGVESCFNFARLLLNTMRAGTSSTMVKWRKKKRTDNQKQF
jgi:positive regulator of sigma E activity